MNTLPLRRTLHPGGPASDRELAVLLSNLWAVEAVAPSRLLVVAAPDLDDGPAVDNRGGGFSGLEPGWGERLVRVSDVLLRTLAAGGEVWAITRRREGRPNTLLARLRERAADAGASGRFRTAEVDSLPAGVCGDGFALTGAMAFTHAGPRFAGGGVVFDPDPPPTARASFEGCFR